MHNAHWCIMVHNKVRNQKSLNTKGYSKMYIFNCFLKLNSTGCTTVLRQKSSGNAFHVEGPGYWRCTFTELSAQP